MSLIAWQSNIKLSFSTFSETLSPRFNSAPAHKEAELLASLLLWGKGNGTPLQYSCLENPMDGGA